jgi:hypothetical protein
MQTRFIGSDSLGFADSVAGHEETFVLARASLEKLEMFRVELPAKRPTVRVERFRLVIGTIFKLALDFLSRWKSVNQRFLS